MKLRIQDNSVRLRITLRELEELVAGAVILRRCAFPGGRCLEYSLCIAKDREASVALLSPFRVAIELSPADATVLADPAEEGISIRREWIDENGAPARFMALVEKDRPASTCRKVEAWIYEGHDGGEPTLKPIPGKSK